MHEFIFYSTQDPAGSNIAKCLRENYNFEQIPAIACGEKKLRAWKSGDSTLAEVEELIIEADFLKPLEADLVVFASKHKSASGKPCFTVHAPGNFGPNAMGGNSRELAFTSAHALNAFYKELQGKQMPVFREATHHGPTSLRPPCVFVEVGSTEAQWKDVSLAETAAQAIVDGSKSYASEKSKVALGFGGTHYCTAFEKRSYAFSHVASKHSLEFVDQAMVKQALEKTAEKVDVAFIDEKGCNGAQRETLVSAFQALGLKYELV